jgi:uncharacterized membrane protein
MVKNLNQLHQEKLKVGDRIADGVAKTVGSWRFITIQSIILVVWLIVNIMAWVNHWDPYPFILLNLLLSFQAAYAAPIIMMSQNRQEAKDRIRGQLDYETDVKAEQQIELIKEHLKKLEQEKIDKILAILEKK